jgi:transcription factor IIIB subunit 2
MVKNPRKTPAAKPKASRPNPARAINDRDHRRKQIAEYNASRASSSAGSPPPVNARSQCPNPKCSAPNLVDGTCQSCGAVVDDSNIVADVQFGEASNGQAIAFGVTVGHDQAGPRLGGPGFGPRRAAGGGDGENRIKSILEGRDLIIGLLNRLDLGQVEGQLYLSAFNKFKEVLGRNFCQGRSIPRVASVCVYWAIRKERNTPVMLIDIADVVKIDVFLLGRTFKKMLNMLYGGDEANYPFEPMVPEDIIRRLASRLEFYNDTDQIQAAAVRIVQRMDRDWMMLGRKPAGICGSALILAARMFNYRRTPLEVSFVAKVTTATLKLRLDEFARLEAAQMRISDFMKGEFPGQQKSHDPPAFYRQTREYQEEMEKKKNKPGRKRKRPVIDQETGEPIQPDKRSREDPQPDSAATSQGDATPSEQPRTDADGFAIPAPPQRQPASSSGEETQRVTEDDISEAVPTDEQDEVEALASKYGDVPLPGLSTGDGEPGASGTQHRAVTPGAKSHRNRLQGSSLRNPALFSESEEWTEDENKMAEEMLSNIRDINSKVWVAAADAAGLRTQELMEELEIMRPANYQQNQLLDAPEVMDDEFADDPEVVNCLLNEEERKIKEQLWLNENKDWLRLQQEKEFKKKMAPVKKPRKPTTRKPRIGEGQATPASSAEEAAQETANRRGISTKINYAALTNMDRKGPGSLIGSEIASQPTSRTGSAELSDSDSDDDDYGLGNDQGNENEEGEQYDAEDFGDDD